MSWRFLGYFAGTERNPSHLVEAGRIDEELSTDQLLQLAEIELGETCAAAGRTIRDLRVRHATGAMIVALRRHDGTFDTTPEPDTRLDPGDILIGVGSPDEIARLEDLFALQDTVVG